MHREFILGIWYVRGLAPDGNPWLFECEFTPNEVTMRGSPRFLGTANYTIVKEIESLLVLQLNTPSGDLAKRGSTMRIGVDKRNNQLFIDQRLYQRTKQTIIGKIVESPNQLI